MTRNASGVVARERKDLLEGTIQSRDPEYSRGEVVVVVVEHIRDHMLDGSKP